MSPEQTASETLLTCELEHLEQDAAARHSPQHRANSPKRSATASLAPSSPCGLVPSSTWHRSY